MNIKRILFWIFLVLSVKIQGQSYNCLLHRYLTDLDSIENRKGVAIPADCKVETVSYGTPLFKVKTKKCTIFFGDGSVRASSSDGKVSIDFDPQEKTRVFEFLGYEPVNNVVYCKVKDLNRNYEGGQYQLVGGSMETGKTFTFYLDTTNISHWFTSEYVFSPNLRYILKWGDKSYDDVYNDFPNSYGWSLIDTRTGEENGYTYERYYEFVYNLAWIDTSNFWFIYVKIPFDPNKGAYTQDYKYFYSILESKPIADLTTGNKIYPVQYFMDTKLNVIRKENMEFNFVKKPGMQYYDD